MNTKKTDRWRNNRIMQMLDETYLQDALDAPCHWPNKFITRYEKRILFSKSLDATEAAIKALGYLFSFDTEDNSVQLFTLDGILFTKTYKGPVFKTRLDALDWILARGKEK